MTITKRHPMMKSALRAESGVFGTYAAAVVAMLCTTAAVALLVGTPRNHERTSIPTTTPAIGSIWVDMGEQRAPGTEQSASSAAAAATRPGLDIKGADLSADQPVYDEAAAVSIYLR